MTCANLRANLRVRTARRLGIVAMLASCAPLAGLAAQAVPLPALQLPVVSERDYTVALVGGGGTGTMVQWREAATGRAHVLLEGGIADPVGQTGPMLLMGVGLAQALTAPRGVAPIDLLVTGGASLALHGKSSVVRIPVGVSVGRAFELEGGMQLTPFVHPRLSLDYCARCGAQETGRSSLSVNMDLGAAWRFEPRWELLAALAFTGSELVTGDQSLSVGLRFVPESLRRR